MSNSDVQLMITTKKVGELKGIVQRLKEELRKAQEENQKLKNELKEK